jgi:hypothetical protein
MALTGNQLRLAVLIGFLCAYDASAAESKDYQKLVELSFAHLDCAAFGMLTADERHSKFAQKSFLRGSLMLIEWLDDVRSGKAPRASVDFVPKEVKLMPMAGTPTQFHVGYIWAQVEMQAKYRLPIKSSSWFFAFGEHVEQLKRVEAEKQFENAKCEILN